MAFLKDNYNVSTDAVDTHLCLNKLDCKLLKVHVTPLVKFALKKCDKYEDLVYSGLASRSQKRTWEEWKANYEALKSIEDGITAMLKEEDPKK